MKNIPARHNDRLCRAPVSPCGSQGIVGSFICEPAVSASVLSCDRVPHGAYPDGRKKLIEVKAAHPTCAQLHQREGEARPIKFGASFLSRGCSRVHSFEGICPPCPSIKPCGQISMRTFYFDMKDGVPTRDRMGLEFPSAGGAIAHSKEIARRLRDEPRLKDPALAIVVVDESGAEVHREPVYPDTAKSATSSREIENFNRID
jgi:hypothetical protein